MPLQEFGITRLPQTLVRREDGYLKDHVLLLRLEGTDKILAMPVSGKFAGYLAMEMVKLASSPEQTANLERRSIEDKDIHPDTRIIFQSMVRQAKIMQEAQTST